MTSSTETLTLEAEFGLCYRLHPSGVRMFCVPGQALRVVSRGERRFAGVKSAGTPAARAAPLTDRLGRHLRPSRVTEFFASVGVEGSPRPLSFFLHRRIPRSR